MNVEKFLIDIKDKKKLSVKQEKSVAKKYGGRTTIGSGNLHFDKLDVKFDKVRVECKRTDKEQFILKKSMLIKAEEQCGLREVPAFNIEIQDKNWYLVRPAEFEYILALVRKEK